MLTAEQFVRLCAERRMRFFTGVPCSYLAPVINCAMAHPSIKFVMATSEGEAASIAAGAYLAGQRPVIFCQNSGLGNMVNPLTSLLHTYHIPALLLISHRGEPGTADEEQHELMGQITTGLLDTLRIPWEILPRDIPGSASALSRADEWMRSSSLPYSLIFRKALIEPLPPSRRLSAARYETRPCGAFRCPEELRMSRKTAIAIVREHVHRECALLATTGKVWRELMGLGDLDSNFYMLGSMGCTAAIGLGFCISLPSQPVAVLDGDGALLMKMGALATIGQCQPSPFLHVVLDNEVYETTGRQPTAAPVTDFAQVASATNYRFTARADTPDQIITAMDVGQNCGGPALIHIKVSPNSEAEMARMSLTPPELTKRFMNWALRREKPTSCSS